MKKITYKKIKLLLCIIFPCVILICFFVIPENKKIKQVDSKYKRIKAYLPVKAGEYYFWTEEDINGSGWEIYYSKTQRGKGKKIVSGTKGHSLNSYGYTNGKQLIYVTSQKKSSKNSTLCSMNLSNKKKIKYVTEKYIFDIINVYRNNIFYQVAGSGHSGNNIKKISLKKTYKAKTVVEDFFPSLILNQSTRYIHGYGKLTSERNLKVYDCKTGKLRKISSYVEKAQLKNKKLYYAVNKDKPDSTNMQTFKIYCCAQNGTGEKTFIAELKAVMIGSISSSVIFYTKRDKNQIPHLNYYYYDVKQKNSYQITSDNFKW